MEFILLILGRKLLGSLLNVISSCERNLFIPASKVCGLKGEKTGRHVGRVLLKGPWFSKTVMSYGSVEHLY